MAFYIIIILNKRTVASLKVTEAFIIGKPVNLVSSKILGT